MYQQKVQGQGLSEKRGRWSPAHLHTKWAALGENMTCKGEVICPCNYLACVTVCLIGARHARVRDESYEEVLQDRTSLKLQLSSISQLVHSLCSQLDECIQQLPDHRFIGPQLLCASALAIYCRRSSSVLLHHFKNLCNYIHIVGPVAPSNL